MSAIEIARNHLYEICKDPKKFRMCVPVNKNDSDMIFVDAFDYGESMEKRVIESEKRLVQAIEFLKHPPALHGGDKAYHMHDFIEKMSKIYKVR